MQSSFLLCKYEDLSLDPRKSYKELGVTWYTCNPSAGRQDKMAPGGPLALAHQWVLDSVSDSVSKIKAEKQRKIPDMIFGFHMHVQVN